MADMDEHLIKFYQTLIYSLCDFPNFNDNSKKGLETITQEQSSDRISRNLKQQTNYPSREIAYATSFNSIKR